MGRLFRNVAAGVLLGLALLPGGRADAAASLGPCPGKRALQCGQIVVPLDRTGQTAGTISLYAEVLPAPSPARGVMFLLAGGPGQSAARAFGLADPDNAQFLRFLFPGYTLVAFDERGTGSSGVLRCPGLEAAPIAPNVIGAKLAADCATALGPARLFYATRDQAEDIEAVRQALGVDRIALYGVSYGTKLAMAYALAHPNQVERILLDSVLPPELPDPLMGNVLRELPKALASLCAGGVCRTATKNFPGEVVALANRLASAPLRAAVLRSGGVRKLVSMSGEQLLYTVIQADLNPGLAAELPAAVHAARKGEPRPLLRLWDLLERTASEPAEELSVGLYAATTCEDGLFPWQPNTPLEGRSSLLDAAIAAAPARAFGPFGRWAARVGTAGFCRLWPAPAGGAALPSGPLPDVPVLAVAGELDMRTPLASAAAVVAKFPQGRLLAVPGIGHSVLATDFSLCSQQAVRAWVASGVVRARCSRDKALVAPIAAFAASVSPPGARTAGLPGRTLAAALTTLREAEAAWLFSLASSKRGIAIGGVYAGKLVASQETLALRRYSIVPGLELSGTLQPRTFGPPLEFAGDVTVSGARAASGKLRVTGETIRGTLAGRAVKSG